MTVKFIKVGIIVPYLIFEEQRNSKDLLSFTKAIKFLVIHNLKAFSFKQAFNAPVLTRGITYYLAHPVKYIKIRSAYKVFKLVVSVIDQAIKISSFHKSNLNSYFNNKQHATYIVNLKLSKIINVTFEGLLRHAFTFM